MTGYRSIGIRAKAAFIFICILFAFLVYHLYQVQIRRHEELLAKARSRYTTVRKSDGVRGEIFDYYGNLLVGNNPVGNVIADPSALKTEDECREAAAFLAKELDLPEAEIYLKLSNKKITVTDKNGKKQRVDRRYVLIKKDIDFDQFERNRLNIERSKISGIRCTVSFRRTYPKNQMLANILGFTTIDRDQVIAKSGLEKYFDDEISPETGIKVVEVSRKGVTLNTISQKPEHDGYDLFLTIREPIQAILEEEIDKMMEATQAQHGFAIMADPYTGDIIALAQRPTFNPNDRSTLKEASSRNPVAEMAFEPGSIMKPFPVAGALDLGIISPETRFDCEQGRWFFAGKILRDTHKLGRITVSEIIQHSSNIGTAKIALEIGEPRLKNILTSFGFGQRTGAPLRPETVGLFYRNPTKISITRYPIGQGISASPLQLVRAYCILANGGYPVQLRFVDRIRQPNTDLLRKLPVQRGKKLFRRASTSHEIVEMMKRVPWPGGTAKSAAIRGYYVAGKTGTAQKFVNGAYSHSLYTASFVGFVPADKPRFVLLVTCDEPKGKAVYGGSAAGPYFSSIGERTLKYLRVPPDVSYEKYDAEWKADEKRVMDEKIRLWAKEREERERRRNGSLQTNSASRSSAQTRPAAGASRKAGSNPHSTVRRKSR